MARGYDRVFGRDGALCAIAAARSGDRTLIRGARRTLAALAAHQAANGQIPKFVEPEAQRGDFWYLGCIDATLWWLIAIKLVDQSGGGRLEHRLQARIRRALAWLGCQEHPLIHLLQQNEASDWADIMPRSGFVLYTNALWLYVKKLYRLPGGDADPAACQLAVPARQPSARLPPPAPADPLCAAPQSHPGPVPQLRQPFLLGRGGRRARQPARPVAGHGRR